MNESDRRVRRSRRLLGKALLTLMQDHPFDRITIREITEKADVAYATFFRHYTSPEDLLLQELEKTIQELESLATQTQGDYFQRERQLLFEHVQQHQLLYRRMFESHKLAKHLRIRLSDHILNHLKTHIPADKTLPIPLSILANHIASSLLALLEWWLDHRQTPSPAEMGVIYERLIIQATWSVLPPEFQPHPE